MANNVESQELALQLNKFYRDNYRRVMKWLSVMVVVCAVLSAILAWISYDRTQPPYYAAVTTGQVLRIHSLSEPVITQPFILQWSEMTTQIIYNISFDQYQQQLAVAKDRFTPGGWDKMMSALQSSGLLTNLVSNRLIMNSVVSGTPVIIGRMIVNGRFTWRVQLKLLVTFTGASGAVKREQLVTMDIQRVPSLDSEHGIQIINFVSSNMST